MTQFSLTDLESIIAARATSGDDTSWTAKLLGKGIGKASEKVGEESIETIIAAISQTAENTRDEAADLLYHLLVVLYIKGVAVEDVMAELQRRTSQSGLAEKASRGSHKA